jgi:hypothetical protein
MDRDILRTLERIESLMKVNEDQNRETISLFKEIRDKVEFIVSNLRR